jgi:hypothetical protein
MGCVAGTCARCTLFFWPSRLTVPMLAPLMWIAPRKTSNSKQPNKAIVACLFKLTVMSVSVMERTFWFSLRQLHSLRLRWTGASPTTASESSSSDSLASSMEFAGTGGSSVTAGVLTTLAAASVLNRAAAMAVRGFPVAPAPGPASSPLFLFSGISDFDCRCWCCDQVHHLDPSNNLFSVHQRRLVQFGSSPPGATNRGVKSSSSKFRSLVAKGITPHTR